jgi:transposase
MSVLDKDIINSEMLPHLQTYSHGRALPPAKFIGIIQLILFRLKTGCQWRELPMKQFIDIPYNWRSVYHHHPTRFDPELYKHRTVIEHAFAWMDAFKSLLIRFETASRNWLNLNILGFMVIFARKRQLSF